MLDTMEWREYTSHRLIQTRHWLIDLLELQSTTILEQVRLLKDLLVLEIPDADDLFSAIDIHAADYGVFMWAGGDDHFDLGIGFGEAGKVVCEEGPVGLG